MNDLAVLIPAYRANDTIVRTLRSLAAQTYRPFDVFVLIDGEYDGFPARTCLDIVHRGVRRLWLGAHRQNQGEARTRNDLLAYARGYKYVAWQDADDESEPERLRLQVEYLDTHPDIFMVGTWMTEVQPNGRTRGVDTPTEPADVRKAYGEAQQAVSGATAMFRLPPLPPQWQELARLRYRDVPIGWDYIYHLEVQRLAPLSQANVGQRLYRYHRRPDSVLKRYRAEVAAGRAEPLPELMRRYAKEYGHAGD